MILEDKLKDAEKAAKAITDKELSDDQLVEKFVKRLYAHYNIVPPDLNDESSYVKFGTIAFTMSNHPEGYSITIDGSSHYSCQLRVPIIGDVSVFREHTAVRMKRLVTWIENDEFVYTQYSKQTYLGNDNQLDTFRVEANEEIERIKDILKRAEDSVLEYDRQLGKVIANGIAERRTEYDNIKTAELRANPLKTKKTKN